MKIYDIDTLSNVLYEDLTWRIREISDLRQIIKLSDASLKKTILRAGVPLAYAHWEGHIKLCSMAYASFVSSKRLRLAELKYGYSLGELRSHLDKLVAKQTQKIVQMDFLMKMDSMSGNKFGSSDRIVDTRSNLSTDVLIELGSGLNWSTMR